MTVCMYNMRRQTYASLFDSRQSSPWRRYARAWLLLLGAAIIFAFYVSAWLTVRVFYGLGYLIRHVLRRRWRALRSAPNAQVGVAGVRRPHYRLFVKTH